MTTRQILYLSHGSPDLSLTDHPARAFLADLGARLIRPPAALVISAHFEAPGLVLGSAATPATWHDFHGFPEPLYRLRYPAAGAPTMARQLSEDLAVSGIDARLDPTRPLDHGIWSPLSLLWPDADVPLIPVSVPMAADTATQLQIAAALGRWAATNGVMLIGSGAATHNLGARHVIHDAPDTWARQFHDWAIDVAARGDLDAMRAWRDAPNARYAHPTPEHFLPLLMCVGAVEGRPLRTLHESFMFGNLSMLALGSEELPGRLDTAAA
ncbi:DODA-type extradiol aromatic ring-opening family dioxygenase [Salinicola lusitanus]|uniref:DODA-type extradiol aromatic ring-opening family dioxygenase n=1 Tax=Salinicola lusitanus TaxID=1949085 RepID=UPI000DA26331|nr:class III extradiol ring-cleavage dioxygenase [Salinicola lusitanus]